MSRHPMSWWMDRAAAAALVVLAAALPFEVTHPALVLGPLSLSNVELLMYIALGLAALATGLSARSLRVAPRPVAWVAILAWVMVLLLSGLGAREPRDEAARFALRSVGAAGLAFAVARATAIPWARVAILAGIALGACASAALGAIEGFFPVFGGALAVFRVQSFSLAGYPRAMGPFQYPTIAAMSWEASVPVVLGLIATSRLRRRHRLPIALAAGAVFGAAIAATLSRAGMAICAIVLLIMALVAWFRNRPAWPAVIAGVAGYVLAAGCVFFGSPAVGARLSAESDSILNRAEVRVQSGAQPSVAGDRPFTLAIELVNRGIEPWPATGPRAVVASYHWIDATRATYLLFEGARSPLPADVAPGVPITLELRVIPPPVAGGYVLQLDLQRQDGAWFTQKGNAMPELAVEVMPSGAPRSQPDPAQPRAYVPPSEQGEVGRLDLWRVALRMFAERPWFGIGPDNFRQLYGTYLNRREFNTSIHANSLYFDTLANLGMAGFAALIALGALSAKRFHWLVRDRDAGREAWLQLVVLVALGAFFAHGLFDYFLEFTPTYGLFWVLAGCAGWPQPAAARA